VRNAVDQSVADIVGNGNEQIDKGAHESSDF
jgi:hypothetical protein